MKYLLYIDHFRQNLTTNIRVQHSHQFSDGISIHCSSVFYLLRNDYKIQICKMLTINGGISPYCTSVHRFIPITVPLRERNKKR